MWSYIFAELFSLADVTRTAEDCRLLFEFRTALPRYGYKIQGEFYCCLCVRLSVVACHKTCVMLYNLIVHTLCHVLLWKLKKKSQVLLFLYSAIKIKCVLYTEQIKFLLEDLAILACIWLLNHCSETFQL